MVGESTISIFVSGIDESIEGDVSAQVLLSFDVPPGNLTSIRVTPNSSGIDVGAGAGNPRTVLIGSAGTTITVVAVNEALADDPETINNDPYGDGWIVRMQPTGDGATMSPDEYQALLDQLDA